MVFSLKRLSKSKTYSIYNTSNRQPNIKLMKIPFLIVLSGLMLSGFISAQVRKTSDSIRLKEIVVFGVKEGSSESGYRNDTAGLAHFGNAGLIDIPLSVNVTSGELIENTGAHNLLDALKTNSSVIPTIAPNNDERGLSAVTIRGFTPNYLLDGLPVNSYHMPSVDNVEQIETLNGLNSFFYGFSSMGGAINFVTKKPVERRVTNLSMGVYNGGVNYLHLDVGGSITRNKRLTYRLNGYKEDGGTFIKGQHQQNTMYSGAVNYKLFQQTNVRFDVYHQDSYLQGQQNVFTVNPSKNILLPLASSFDPKVLYGQPWTYSNLRFDQVGVSLDSKINKTFNVRAAYRYGDALFQYNYVVSAFTDNKGDFTETDKDFAPSQRYYHAGSVLFDAKLSTYNVKHEITFGYFGYDQLIHFGGNPGISVVLGNYNITSPRYVTMPDTIPHLSDKFTDYNRYYYNSFVAGDRISFNKHFSAIIGVSEAFYKTIRTSGNLSQAGTANYTQHKLIPNLAFIYKPFQNISLYASYEQGIGIGGIAPDAAKNAGEMMTPGVNEQYEAGIKTNLKTINLSLSYFRINVVNEYLDPTDTIYKQDGREVHQGIEFNTFGRVIKNLTLGGGFTVMDVKVIRALNNHSIEGKIPQNIPENYANIYLEYSMPFISGLSVSAHGTYCGQRPVDAANLAFTKAYSVYDAGIRYRVNIKDSKVTLNVNVTNLMDTRYIASYTSTGLRLGVPRLLSLSVKFEL